MGGGRRREGLSFLYVTFKREKVSRVGGLFGCVHHVLVAVGEPKEIRRGVMSLKPHLTDLAAPTSHMHLSPPPLAYLIYIYTHKGAS